MSDRLKALFEAAAELGPEARARFVDGLAADDSALRAPLARLLAAHDAAGDFLEHPTDLVDDAVTAGDADSGGDAASAADRADDGLEPGQRLADYRLVERLGRGGFGSVWRARQERPVVRDVALKVLLGDVDPERLLARFAFERQALARMQHPGIAKVFDAGAAGGRCWLAMELVEGEPIARHVRDRGLDLRARLRLFVEVCRAVQHAHGKGLVHRDLKPSNILVLERDGRPAPVVIDFGVAVARDADAGPDGAPASTTALGTPEYMSPEQAAASTGDVADVDVDTRTDVYALGVVLYELLCERRPFARRDGESARALLRRIRAGSAPRATPPAALRRGADWREIDWLLRRAMAQRPADRYQTAAALADDIQRLLRSEPLEAAPGGAIYRLSRFARRNRWLVLGGAITFASLAAGTFFAVRGMLRAQAAEAQARDDQHRAERASHRANRALLLFDQLWGSVDPARFGRADYPVRELFADFERELPRHVAGEPEVELRVRAMLGGIERTLGLLPGAEAHAVRAVELARQLGDGPALIDALYQLGLIRLHLGRFADAELAADEARRLAAAAAPPDLAAVAAALRTMADCRQRLDDHARAEALAAEALALCRQLGDPSRTAGSLMQLAALAGSAGRIDTAMEHIEAALELLAPLGERTADAMTALQHKAFLLQRRGRYQEAEVTLRETLRRRREAYGDDHPHVAWTEADLGWLLREQRRYGEAAALLTGALAKLRARLGENHLYVTEAMQRLGAVRTELDELDAAAELLDEAVRRYRTLPGHPAEGLAGCLGNLASLRCQQGDRQEGLRLQREALAVARTLPPDHFIVSLTLTNTAWMLRELGEPEAALRMLREAHERSVRNGRAGEARIQAARIAELEQELAARGREDGEDR